MASKRWLPAALLLPLVAASGCGPTAESPAVESPAAESPAAEPSAVESPAAAAPGSTVTVDLDDRPFRLHVPESYDPAAGVPLVVLLHGYTSSATEQESYFRLTAESDRRGFLYAMPDGTPDQRGDQFWNATDACCDFYHSGTDDAAYLRRLIDTMVSSYPVDPARVYLVGHSNGGFMAHRMACDHAAVITAIVSLAGMAPDDASQCAPQRPVSVLQIHGTDDTVIQFDGGDNAGRPYPSVGVTLRMWRDHNGCRDRATTGPPLNLAAGLPGRETTVTAYTTGCRDATGVTLWAIEDGGHVPALTRRFAPAVVEFLYAQVAG